MPNKRLKCNLGEICAGKHINSAKCAARPPAYLALSMGLGSAVHFVQSAGRILLVLGRPTIATTLD